MSEISPLRCLFCNLRNVASAKYCNECASPLHLQPCNKCGAIDNRTAITCYKCGAEFNVPAAKRARVPATSKRARVPAARKRAPAPAAPEPATVPAAPVPESLPALPILEPQSAKPTSSDGGFAIERAFLSKSLAQVVGMDKTVAPEGVQYPVLALSAVEPRSMDETVESEWAMAATASRRARRLAYLTLLLAATAAFGYYYYDRSAERLAQGQSVGQPVSSMSGSPISAGATTASVATQVDATSAPRDTAQAATRAEEVEKAPLPAAPVVAKPRTDPEPVTANRPLDDPASVSRQAAMPQRAGAALSVRPSPVIDAGAKSLKDPPIFKECTEAVAALGLCSPSK